MSTKAKVVSEKNGEYLKNKILFRIISKLFDCFQKVASWPKQSNTFDSSNFI